MPDSSDVAERIEAHLADLGLGPGDRLPSERALAGELGISRPALREAMRRLVANSVVRPRRGSGTFLVAPDLHDLLVVRRALEPLAARLAARHASESGRAEVAELTARLAGALREPRRFAALDLELHQAIARASGNAVLLGCLQNVDQMLRLSRAQTAGDLATRRATLADMQRMTRAIADRRPARAAAAMDVHLARIGEALGDG